MRKRKLQIFLSSTYGDLISHRLAAMEAILAAGHIPAAMEQFSPGDETAWETIRTWIDESDAFILILGGRYGSIEPKSGTSYVELEYDYAIEQKKPLFALVVSPDQHEARVREFGLRVDERDHPLEYKQFHNRVTEKLCRFWHDERDIKVAIFQKLPEWDRKQELTGWVRGSEAADPQAINELARLSRENRELREAGGEEMCEGVNFNQMLSLLSNRPLTDLERQFLGNFNAQFDASTLLEFFRIAADMIEGEGRLNIPMNAGLEYTKPVQSLVVFGLLERWSDTSYVLSPPGRRFRNRLLLQGQNPQPPLHSDPNLR